MTNAVGTQPIEAPPTEAPHTDALRDLVHAAASGNPLLLGAGDCTRALTLGGLAARALEERLGATRLTRLPVANDQSRLAREAGLRTSTFPQQERGFIHAGALYEAFLEAVKRAHPTHVVCLDPWTACIRPRVEDVCSDAVWVYVSDVNERKHGSEADYWEQYASWVRNVGFDFVVDARLFLDYLPDTAWLEEGATSGPAGLAEILGRDTGFVLIDESSDTPPAPAIIEREIVQAAKRPSVLLTPHLQTYRADAPGLLDHVTVALSTPDLSVRVYSSLLRSCASYVVPSRLPFGAVPVRLVPDTAELRVGEEARRQLPDQYHRRADGVGMPSHAPVRPQPQPQDVRERAPVEDLPGQPPGLASWWRQLGDVVSPQDEQPSAAAEVSILTCCYKYLQRFRIFLDSIARQEHPRGKIEVCVAAPGNPDGLLEYLDLYRTAHPHVQLKVATVPEDIRTNRGKMINAAFDISTASTLMVADGDIILPKSFFRSMLDHAAPQHVLGCWRVALSDEVTAHIITGNLDPVDMFDSLREKWDAKQMEGVREGVLGYCQIVRREVFEEVRYPEEIDRINQSDIEFVERVGRAWGVMPEMAKDVFVLHLAHPRDWSGTKVFL